MMLSSGIAFSKRPTADIPVPGSPDGFAHSGGVASPPNDVTPGDFLELAALSGSSEWALLSCKL
jgi:hypothetical protein